MKGRRTRLCNVAGDGDDQREDPTVYEWAGGAEAFERLTECFYRRVREDELLGPVFANMPADHPKHVAAWLAEVFGGPPRYTEEHGGYRHMVRKHHGLAITEERSCTSWTHADRLV